MSVLEITLLIFGLLAFVVSFFIPDKGNRDDVDYLAGDEIRNLIDEEIENSRQHISDSVDEVIQYSVEKAERSLERVTNEKMLAFGEYSDSTLNQISKNHQETVFLHDMLNKNKNDLTLLLGQAVTDSKQAIDTAKKANELAKEAENTANKALSSSKNAKDLILFAEEKMNKTNESVKPSKSSKAKADIAQEKLEEQMQAPDVDIEVATEEKVVKKTSRKKAKAKEPVLQDGVLMDTDGQISLKFDADEENSKNSNDIILRLHKQGKSNMAIAKELGLGIGEVKLVIDLFEKKKKPAKRS